MSNKSGREERSASATSRDELITAARNRRSRPSKVEVILLDVVAVLAAIYLGWTLYSGLRQLIGWA